MLNKIFIAVLISSGLLISACSEQSISREDEIRLYIEKGVEAAENRDAGDLSDMLDDSYHDPKGLTKQQMNKMLGVYFFRHKNIHLFTKIRDIHFHSDLEATVVLHVAMAGSVIANSSVLSSLRARVYKFELHLIKHDEWLLQQAKWQPASLSDVQ